MGDIVKFGKKTEEEKYEEALLSQYKEHYRQKEADLSQSVGFVINREKSEIAKRIEELCRKLGVLFGWRHEYVLEKKFFSMELTTIQIVLSIPDVTIETEEAKKIFSEAVNLADWSSIGSFDGEISIVFYIKDVVKFKTIKK